MDAEYLKETVGIALAQGIAETSISKPDDPIEFLGLWLIKYVENKKREAKVTLMLLFSLTIKVARGCHQTEGTRKSIPRKLGTPKNQKRRREKVT